MALIGKTNPHARRLRRDGTDAEHRLWHHLRNRQLGGYKFRRQVTIGPFVADFACVDARLIVEADGGQHSEIADRGRSEYFRTLGWKILRFWNHDILQETDAVLQAILAACNKRMEGRPSPNTRPHAGEG